MNNARATLNALLGSIVTAKLPGWAFFTGDERNPTMTTPHVSVQWLAGGGKAQAYGQRLRLVQLEVEIGSQDSWGAEAACEVLLKDLGLLVGSGMAAHPLRDFAMGAPGVIVPSAQILLRQDEPWRSLPARSAQGRRRVLTLTVEYTPA